MARATEPAALGITAIIAVDPIDLAAGGYKDPDRR